MLVFRVSGVRTYLWAAGQWGPGSRIAIVGQC